MDKIRKCNGVKPVRVAVIGCGAISGIYIENMQQKFSILEVVGCCALHRESMERTAEKYGLTPMTMEEILADPTIEMVVNLTTPTAHFEITRQLLLGGKHVYSEKPLAVEPEQAEELEVLAQERGLYLGVAPDTFLGSAIQTARQILDSGLIGTVTSCTASLNRDYGFLHEALPFTQKKGGGIGIDVGIYYMTALAYLLGPVKQVCGFYTSNQPECTYCDPAKPNFGQPYTVETESVMVGSMVYENGALGSVMFNADCTFPEQRGLVLYGTQGILYLANPNEFGGEVKLVRKWQQEPVVIPPNHGFSENSRGVGAAEMAWAMRAGRPNRTDKSMARNALEALQGMVISADTGSVYRCKSTFVRPEPLLQGYIGGPSPAEYALTK